MFIATAEELRIALIVSQLLGPTGSMFNLASGQLGINPYQQVSEHPLESIQETPRKPRKQSRKQKTRAKSMSKALAEVNKKARKKNGQLKANWSQRRIMQAAHKLMKKKK